MSRKPKLHHGAGDDPAAPPSGIDPEAAAGIPPGDARTALESALRERDEYLAHWQRAQADYQNLRRRIGQDLEAGARRAKQPLLLELLLVLDQIEMALALPAAGDEARGFRSGIELVRDQLVRTLEREDVRAVPEGGAFDPALHQAMSTVETDAAPPGSVVETLRRGYTWGDQVLRHAQVRVAAAPDAQGGSKAAGEGAGEGV
jgi:molecular chaperone GrpE